MVGPEPFQEGMRRHARLELLKFGFQLVRTQIGVHSLQITLFWPIDFPFLGKDSAFLALVLGGKGLLTSRGKSRSPNLAKPGPNAADYLEFADVASEVPNMKVAQ